MVRAIEQPVSHSRSAGMVGTILREPHASRNLVETGREGQQAEPSEHAHIHPAAAWKISALLDLEEVQTGTSPVNVPAIQEWE